MVARPGRLQSVFTAGELSPLLEERTSLKYFATGLKHAENIVVLVQGGFRLRDGLRLAGDLPADASRIFPFDASTGVSYDLVFSGGTCQVWNGDVVSATLVIDGVASVISKITVAQRSDTMLLFHQDLKSKRIVLKETGWVVDDLPYANVPNWDYGATYTNGVPAKWRLEFVGLTSGTSIFTLTISNQETQSITFNSTMATLISSVAAAVLDLPNVEAGITVTSPVADVIEIEFTGENNEGDGWAVSGVVVNKADAAIVAVKKTVGVAPGEPVISAARGWPQCGCFWQQRLLVGGFKSLPNAWMFSKEADYFEYDLRYTEASGPAIVPMDAAGGECIEAIVPSLNLLIMTTHAEYWIAERALKKTEAPNHVQASRHGSRRGVPVVENEGAILWCYKNGSTIGELRYTDGEGNFIASDISLLSTHILDGIIDQAIRRADASMDGNIQAIVREDGQARIATIHREQEVVAYARLVADGNFIATGRNGSNSLSFIVEAGGVRSLQRMESGLLLDEAIDFTFSVPSQTVSGLTRFNGREVWAIADRNVFGPFVVAGGVIELPTAASLVTVGTWRPPVVSTLPPARDVGPNTVLKRKARIHSVHVLLTDTTSLAIAVNGGPLREVTLQRFGSVRADVPELDQGYTGSVKISGLRGYSDAPFVTLSQLRPGRLNVRSITVEAAM